MIGAAREFDRVIGTNGGWTIKLRKGKKMMAGISLMTILVFLWGLAITILWLYIAWRAMRAHEKLAQSVEDISKKQ